MPGRKEKRHYSVLFCSGLDYLRVGIDLSSFVDQERHSRRCEDACPGIGANAETLLMMAKVIGIKMEADISLCDMRGIWAASWLLCAQASAGSDIQGQGKGSVLSVLENGHVVMTWLCIGMENMSLNVDMSRSHHVVGRL